MYIMPNQRGNVAIAIVLFLLIASLVYAVTTKIDSNFFPDLINKLKEEGSFKTGFSETANTEFTLKNAKKTNLTQQFNGVDSIKLNLSMKSGLISISSGSGKTITGTLEYEGDEPDIKSTTKNSQGTLDIISSNQGNERRNLKLSPGFPTDINLNMGAGEADLDLTNLDIPILNISAGASKLTITFPGENSTKARITSGAGSVLFKIPEEVGVMIVTNEENSSGLENYQKVAGGFESKNYNTSKNKVDITLEQGSGEFRVETIE